MRDAQTTTQGAGMTLGDIYFVLFRHKWKIILCSVVGVCAAVAFYLLRPPPFQSEAKLFIRYVLDSRSLSPTDGGTKVELPDQRGDTIINSEVEILTSLDLAQQVADAVGPEKILAKAGGGNDRLQAAALVQKNLIIEALKNSSVIRVVFQHPDPAVVQPVLSGVIDSYLKKHAEVHQGSSTSDDSLTQQTDQLRSRLAQTEDELREAYNKAGVISFDDAKKAYAEQITKIREELSKAQAELAERQAALRAMGQRVPQETETTNVEAAATSQRTDEYRSVCSRLDLLRKREQELLMQFTADNKLVIEVRGQITEADKAKRNLEEADPRLASLGVPIAGTVGQRTAPQFDPLTESARMVGLESKIKSLNSQLDEIRGEVASVNDMEGTIQELQRKKALQESNYRYFSANLEQSRIDEALSAGRVTNISKIQAPSPPLRARSKSLKKMAMMSLGGVIAGLAWAFLIEFYLDRSVKRPIEFETKLHLPLFLSIPDISRNGHRRLAEATKSEPLLLRTGEGEPKEAPANEPPEEAGTSAIYPQNGKGALVPFYEALRDRLIGYFESKNLTHKPKLVALSGLDKDAGVSTIAAGLAACLSETGEGNVLLVDMNLGQGSALHFRRGSPVCNLDDALYTKDHAQVQDKLYVVSEGSDDDKLPRAFPKRFTHLVPKLKASDFDYIIFDMPIISQTSVTPRLAKFMDVTLLVIESEKTDRGVVKQATALLAESKANVAAVLNKTRTYVPSRLHRDLLTDS
jgi:uncharacterized protein involved in exopolysaccharide biosynthesis/Mrp family chromosome partitioning ATPase